MDLQKDNLSGLSSTDLYHAIEEFTRVTGPTADRMQEGYLVDFKEQWSDSALQTVAAFANTFGGLLIVGVSENLGRADSIVGAPVSGGRELKTTLASSIASNITPTPLYELFECELPQDATRHLCLVRVRRSDILHLLTKKGERPVYVRNEDESRPADAARLQALLSRPTRAVASTRTENELLQLESIGFYVSQARGVGTTAERLKDRLRSETWLRLVLVPDEDLRVRLDLAAEEMLAQVVAHAYPDLFGRLQDGDAITEQSRGADHYHLTYLEDQRDHQMNWLLRANGELHFLTQVRAAVAGVEDYWSLADLTTHLRSTVEATHQFWTFLGYFGEGHLLAWMHTEALSLLQTAAGYERAFYSTGLVMPRGYLSPPLTRHGLVPRRAYGRAELTFASRTQSRHEVLAVVLNQLLRDLGYGVRYKMLTEALA